VPKENDEFSNLRLETVQQAIDAVRGRAWDVNPYTVADELKVPRAAIYRHAEAMKLIIAARGGSFGMDVQTSLDLTWQLRKLEQQNIELQQKLASSVVLPSSVESSRTLSRTGKTSIGTYQDSGDTIFSLVDDMPSARNYFDQLADLSWKDLETVYYFKVASLRDHAKNLFKSDSKSDGANGGENLNIVVQPIENRSLPPTPPVTTQKDRRRQPYTSPFAQLKSSGANVGSIQKEAVSEQALENKLGILKDEKGASVDKTKPVSEVIASTEFDTLVKLWSLEQQAQPAAKAQEIEQAEKIEPPKVIELPKEIESAKVEGSLSAAELSKEMEQVRELRQPVPSKLETFMLLAAEIRAKLAEKIDTKKEAEPGVKTEIRIRAKTEAETEAKIEIQANMQAKTEAQVEAKIEPNIGTEVLRADQSVPLEIEAQLRTEPKLIPYSKTEPLVKKIAITGVSGVVPLIGPQSSIQGELDTGDVTPIEIAPITVAPTEVLPHEISPVESSPAIEIPPAVDRVKSIENKAFDEEDKETSGIISGDELRDLIQSHIKNTTEQLAENSPGYSIGSGKEFEVWLNNPSRNKFIGSSKSQEAANAEENMVANTSDTYGFRPHTVPPEVRKACLILGVRQDRISYNLVQEAWKKAITGPGVHPDLGGDTELAVYLNTAKDILMRWLDAQAPKLGKKFGPFRKEKEPPAKKEKKDRKKEDQ